MASVHMGRLEGSVGFKRVVAIKRLNKEAASDKETRASIQDEALIASRITHRNVVQVFDVVEAEGDLLLVMEYVHGLSLSTLVKEAHARKQAIPPMVASAVIADALEGLHAAHSATDPEGKPLEIVHRDMSPQNILVGADGVARVLDFGIAYARVKSQQTTPGLIKGKVAYLSPEQIHGKATRSSDIYSTGLVLYEALAGRRAVDNFANEGEAMAGILLGNFPKIETLRSELPAALTAIVDKALAREPSARFATAHEMANALRNWGTASPDDVAKWVATLAAPTLERRQRLVRLAESSKEVASEPASHPRRAMALWLGVGAGLMVVLGIGLTWRLSHPAPQEPVPALAPVASTAPAVIDAGLDAPKPDPVETPPVSKRLGAPARSSKRSRQKDCTPNFWIDKNGHKQFKPECF
jgi:serine/threonine protein kinase